MKQRKADGCKLERVVAAMTLWSNSTCLATFGHASAWPVYLFFGNLSKYACTSGEGGACQPISFLPCVSTDHAGLRYDLLPDISYVFQLPDSIHQFLLEHCHTKNKSDMLAHCKRELMHAAWRALLDNEFVGAYKNGIVVKCFDGIVRCIYPRIFTYSTDYPEK